MNKFSKFVLVIFSVIILVIGVGINLIAIKWLDINMALDLIEKALTSSPSDKIILVISEFGILFALISIFIDSTENKETKTGRDILMKNNSGRLLISRETIENLIDSVVKEFPGAKESTSKIHLDENNNVAVLVDLTVTKDVVIKDLTINMQERIKEAIKKTSDLEVSEVNVRIKNIASAE